MSPKRGMRNDLKVGQIKKLILEEKRCVILTGMQGQQWIGGLNWMVRVDEGLKITRDSVKGLFDLDTEQTEKMNVMELPMESYPLWPVLKRDINPMKVGPMDLNNYGGVETLIFGQAVYLLERKYIKAVISREDYREYLLAWDEGNNPLIIINDGLLFAGIARPMRADVCKMLLEQMRAISQLLPGGTHEPENSGPLKLEAENDSIQLDMEDFDDGKADTQ